MIPPNVLEPLLEALLRGDDQTYRPPPRGLETNQVTPEVSYAH